MESRKVIIVTGASKGIGLACTRILLVKFNACVVAVSRTSTPELESLQKDYPEDFTVIHGDISSPEVTSNVVSTAVSKYGHLDGLILNAGTLGPIGRIGSTSLTPLLEWRTTFETNFFSLVHILQAAIPHLRKDADTIGGRVVFLSSGAAIGGIVGTGMYNATKAAMNTLAHTLANEEPSIVSIAFRPGMVDTDMLARLKSNTTSEQAPSGQQLVVDAYTNLSELVTPAQVGYVLASLVLTAAKDLSGRFIRLKGEECESHREE